ncbi:MAG: aminotransferase class I/II-fold pyridoxal phosphate-dependent enzyme [Pseudomonadota bacterium]
MPNGTLPISLNLDIRGIGHSPTLAINERSAALQAEGRQIHRLGLGQSPFPVPEPVVEALRRHAGEKDYLPVMGLPALRRAVADYHFRKEGVRADPNDVLIGPGSKELMFLAQLCYYGDLVVPTPCWVSYAPQARMLGRKVRLLPTNFAHRWRLSSQQLEALCEEDPDRPRLVILNYPGNPEGSTYRKSRLQDLARVARRYKVILLSDEIYGPLRFDGEHQSVARYYPEGTIVSGGLSKWCGAGGWRLGTFIFPESLRWLRDAMSAAASETYTSVSAPIQHAAITAFEGCAEIDDYLVHARRILSALGHRCTAKLREVGAHMVEPQGGFYVFPDFTALAPRLAARGIRTSVDLCTGLLEEAGVAVLPGTAFNRDPLELTFRIAYVNFNGAAALQASRETSPNLPLDEAWLRARCPETLAAIDRIAAWMNGG